jgi:alpha-glucosidase
VSIDKKEIEPMPGLKWWQKAVFYQIYPRSFADGNGDGIGDFQGMIERLDYLQDLGIDALWLSPHFPSPIDDCGYDVSNYVDVAPEYGTLDDFKRFLDGAHQRDIRVIIDMVMNHSSDQHPWFIESRSSRDNPKRDWYVWLDGVDGKPPNNWTSGFGGPAWEYDPTTEQYYYHYFFKQQPDLNWHNPEVKEAMFDAVRFWLDLGVDGYRLDAIGTIFEDPVLPDHTAELSLPEQFDARLTAASDEDHVRLSKQWKAMFGSQVEQPGVHELMQDLRKVIDEYDDRVLVGESEHIAYYGDGSNELHLNFNFPLLKPEHPIPNWLMTKRLTPAWIRANQQERLAELPPGAWPCNTLGNHDTPRVYSRYGDGQNDDALACISLALMLTLRGTPFLYYGEEIGMTDFLLEDVSQFRDNLGVWLYQSGIEESGWSQEQAIAIAARFGRDKCRTPMQWSSGPNGGFSPEGVKTWLPLNPNYADGFNAAGQQDDPNSHLNFYKEMLRLRKRTPALIVGEYTPLLEESEDCFAFLRTNGGFEAQICLVVLNMSNRSHKLNFDLNTQRSKLLFSNCAREADSDNIAQLSVAPFEIYIGELA